MPRWLLFIALMLWLPGMPGITEAGCQVEQLTQGAIYHAPQLAGQWVMWLGDQTDTEAASLFLYDLTSPDGPILLSEQVADNTIPQMSDKLIAWASGTQTARELFVYALGSGLTTQITDNLLFESSPQLHGEQVVWAAVDGDEGEFYLSGDIFLYDWQTYRTTQISQGEEGDHSPQLYDGRIVWLGVERGQTRVLLYDEGKISVVSARANPLSHPRINGRWAAWMEANENQSNDLLVYDLSAKTQTRLSDRAVPSTAPVLGEDGIVWSAYEGGDTDIFFYDGQAVQQITADSEDDHAPFISGDLIVWVGSAEGRFNIFRYQISTATLTQITDSDYVAAPQVAGENIIWLGNVDVHGGDVFLYGCG